MPGTINEVSQSDFEAVNSWFEENKNSLPDLVRSAFDGILQNYLKLANGKRNQKELLHQLRMAMGMIPKTEKGSSEKKYYRS